MTEKINKRTGVERVQILHFMTQEDQPYGSARRCCERCAARLWIASDGLYTDDKTVYHDPPPGFIACWIRGAIAKEKARDRAVKKQRVTAEEAERRQLEEEARIEREGVARSYVILDRETLRPYLAVSFPSRAIADRELSDLLRHYPEGHEWRARLRVQPRTTQ